MFWRILRRLLFAHRARLTLVLLALGAGAAVTAALLNLETDAEHRLTTEFRSFGANIIITPRNTTAPALSAATLDESVYERLAAQQEAERSRSSALLYVIAEARAPASPEWVPLVIAGHKGDPLIAAEFATLESSPGYGTNCISGTKVAAQLGVRAGDPLLLRNRAVEQTCRISSVIRSGGQEDNQIFVPLDTAQRLASLPQRVSLILAGYYGAPEALQKHIADLAQRIPEADVRGIRQFTEAEAKLYTKIRSLLLATVALILLLTGLCVLAAMAGVAMERERDVGTMKALGGPFSRVLRLFLAEAALLGLLGGAIGGAAGIALSIWLGKTVFGVAAQPRLIVYPVAIGLTVLVAIAGAFPLRRLAGVRPGEILRGVS